MDSIVVSTVVVAVFFLGVWIGRDLEREERLAREHADYMRRCQGSMKAGSDDNG